MKERGDIKYIYKNELDNVCFAHDAYTNSKDFSRRTVSDKILEDRTYKIALNRKYNGYQTGLASMM